MRRAYKFRLYPNRQQTVELESTLETHRRLYNECLSMRQMAWDTIEANIGWIDQRRWFSVQRRTNPFYARIECRSGVETIRRLDKTYANFFRRHKAGLSGGYPRFKGRDRFDSFEFNGQGFRLIDAKLRLFGIGHVRIKQHRSTEGTIKACTIKREAGKWYAIFSCDLGNVKVEPSKNPPVGIDVGIESFLTTSDGAHEPNPAYLKKTLPALRVAGRSVARKKRGGANRRKAVKVLQKVHAKVKNQRRDHHHKLASLLVQIYGLIIAESLNIQGLVRNRRLSRAISDAGWYGFLTILRNKAESAGVQFVDVDAWGTSQECSQCHQKVQKDLKVRWHECSCGCSLHRDVNAARNILARGLAGALPAGGNVVTRSHRLKSRQQLVFNC